MGKTKLYCDLEEKGGNGLSDTNVCGWGKRGETVEKLNFINFVQVCPQTINSSQNETSLVKNNKV
jgi:hypothetical protein